MDKETVDTLNKLRGEHVTKGGEREDMRGKGREEESRETGFGRRSKRGKREQRGQK
jgi:hypothetical protein